MNLHSVKEGESLSDIAALYDADEMTLAESNELKGRGLTVGEQLLILKPTRSYHIKRKEDTERLSRRFGIQREEITAASPWILDSGYREGTVGVKYPRRPYGMAAANGYFYKGCDEGLFRRAIPYLTYVTFAALRIDEVGKELIFSPREMITLAKENGIIPLVKVFDKRKNKDYSMRAIESGFADRMIEYAGELGAEGISLDLCGEMEDTSAFLVELRKRMIGKDMILITECDERTPYSAVDFSDGATLSLLKEGKDPFIEVGERLGAFAMAAEGAKTFVELPTLALSEGEGYGIKELLCEVYRQRGRLEEKGSEILSYRDRRGKEFLIPSLKYTKAILDLVSEYGFMGISFDIGRTPLNFLLLYNALFKTIKSGRVSSRAGYNL